MEPAAGLAGLVKVLLSMERGVVPPSLHVVRPNDHIRFEETPFFLADRVMEWPRSGDGPRRGAVSAFGMGGVNAHVILEEPPAAPVREVVAQESYLVRVDAADETTVRTLAGSYADALAAVGEDHVGDFAFTANTGRAEGRFGTVVSGATRASSRSRCGTSPRAPPRSPAGAAGVRRPWSSCSPDRARSTRAWAGACTRPSPCSGRRSTSARPCSPATSKYR